jgi:glyoxylase I family protein
VAFLVGDLERLQSRLSAGDVAFTLSRSGRKAMFCRDPDGNAVELIQAQG